MDVVYQKGCDNVARRRRLWIECHLLKDLTEISMCKGMSSQMIKKRNAISDDNC